MALDAKMGELVKNTAAKIEELFPTFGTSARSLKLKRIWADERGFDPNDLEAQLTAKHNGQSWGVPLKAEIELIDNQLGKPVGRASTVTLMKLPMMTSRQSFIVDGGEYQVDHLLKLKAGIYTRVKRNGDLVSEFMLRKGGHKNFDILLDRKKSLLNFKAKDSDAKTPLYPLMKVMGVDDGELERQWGSAVYRANKIDNPEAVDKALRKFYERTGGKDLGRPPSEQELKEHAYNYFDQTELWADTTKATLGQPFTKVTGGALTAASTKLLKLERKEVEPDDRDSLIFKEVVHVEDFIPEKITKSASWIRAKIRQTLGHKNSVSEILHGGDLFRRPVNDFFLKGGNVSERSEQTNPAQMLAGNFKTTLVAKDYGGIKDAEKLGDEMRAINPSHFGFLDPMHTPESERTGITLHLGSGVFKEGRDLRTRVYDIAAGKTDPKGVSVPDFHAAAVVLPDQVKWEGGKPIPIASKVKVKLPGGSIGMMPMKDAKYVMPTAKAMFSYVSNLIPFLQNDQGNRASMADKQIEQAISLKYRDAPLVQSSITANKPELTFEKHLGTAFASTTAPVAGKVVKITPDSVHVQDGGTVHKVQLYNNFPLNDPTAMLHSEPTVKVGDHVSRGQVIADSNFTRNGTLSLGTNMRIGYIPYKGYNFEDGIVISQSAAQKLTSEHLHKMRLDIDPTVDETSKHTWKANTARKAMMKPEHWAALDEDGVIKEGTMVLPGQVLATCMAPNVQKSDVLQKAFGTRAAKKWRDKSLTWDSDFIGTVARVVKAPNGKDVQVFVRTEQPAEIGDKLSGRHGNKGIITKILPDHEMPFTLHGDERKPLDILLNPSGVPTRMNVGQVLETAAAKVAEKTGKPYYVNNFAGSGHNYLKQVQDDLKHHGLSDEELVYDPSDVRKPLGSVLVGPQHILKLKHQVEKKLVVRGGESDLEGIPYGYDQDRQPYRGGAHGGQGFGALELYSLLGHNARHNIREMATYKSDQQTPDFWRLIQEGREPPAPKIPFSYQKFESLIKGLGVDVRKEGTALRMVPMTDKEVLHLAGSGKNEIKKPVLVVSKNLKPEKGGFFDPSITGVAGDKWSFLKLTEPLPNPIFVGEKQSKGPIPSLLSLKYGDISVPDIDAIMEGRKELNGKYGGQAIFDALKGINVEEEIKNLKGQLLSKRGAKKDHVHRTLKYLTALKDLNLKPHEAYVLNYLPVIPPIFRPITPTATGDVAKSSLNDLYRNIGVNNERLQAMDPTKFGETIRHELRRDLWNGFKALQSVGDFKPVYDQDSHEERQLKGVLDIIGGDQPKTGYFQERLIKRKQDLSIRSTIVPEPSLHIDELGLPIRAAMELYKPFVVGHLHSKYGYRPDEAMAEMKKFGDKAKVALQEVMDDRPMLLKRDPALHKFSVMAFRPKVVEGKAIKIHPLVTGGYNADFDGDTMAGTVPVSREAVEEAKNMFPSRNLFSPTSFRAMHVPNQEFLLGLHLASGWGKSSGKTFGTVGDLKKAFEDHQVGLTDVVKLKGAPKETTVGRVLIAEGLPSGFERNFEILHDPKFSINKSSLEGLVAALAKKHSDKFNDAVNHLKDLGTHHAFKEGFSIGLKDFGTLPERDHIIAETKKKVDHINSTVRDPHEREAKVIDAWTKATSELDEASKTRFGHGSNRLATMVYSGARGKTEQLRQMISAPMLMQDATGRVVPHPVTRSYGEGLDVGDYWLSQHGARKGTLQRAQSTKEPGAMTKDIINSTISTLITGEDCHTPNGISMSLSPANPYHHDVYDRYLAKDHGPFKAGTMITPAVVDRLRQAIGKDATIQVRSPLKCQHGSGICAKCFGLNELGKEHSVGTNIGIISGQALGEPAMQLAMDAFHTGGLAAGRGGSSVSRIERLKQILLMPKILKGSAILAKTTGTISSITPNPGLGGHDVIINGISHHIREGEMNPALKVGANITKGKSLSHDLAPIHPKELLHVTKDMHEVQRYLVDELYQKLYKDEKVRPRNIELVVRALTNYTRIKDPGSSHWEIGDIVPHSIVEEHNRELKGSKLKPVFHEPILEGSRQIPRRSEDWMARLNYQRLGETVQRGASMAWKSELHGSHPIPGIAYGAELGKPPPGKPKHVY